MYENTVEIVGTNILLPDAFVLNDFTIVIFWAAIIKKNVVFAQYWHCAGVSNFSRRLVLFLSLRLFHYASTMTAVVLDVGGIFLLNL